MKIERYCPHCNKKWLITVSIRARLKKYGQTEVKCRGCSEWFTVFNKTEEEKNDRK